MVTGSVQATIKANGNSNDEKDHHSVIVKVTVQIQKFTAHYSKFDMSDSQQKKGNLIGINPLK